MNRAWRVLVDVRDQRHATTSIAHRSHRRSFLDPSPPLLPPFRILSRPFSRTVWYVPYSLPRPSIGTKRCLRGNDNAFLHHEGAKSRTGLVEQ